MRDAEAGPSSLGAAVPAAAPTRDGGAALRALELQHQRGRRLMPANYVCGTKDHHGRTGSLLQPKLRGVNLGGWMVLEPWLTPSLFYQFEGKPPQETAMDQFTFCSVLGPAEANRQLREHWRKWVTEADLRALVDQGVNTLRIPVGDWMWLPYPPYIGCTDGAVDEFQRLLRICDRLGLRVLIDMHGVRRSQNGFDNSGHATNVTWSADGQSFSHWPTRSAGWQGTFDPLTMTYSSISWDNVRTTVQVLQRIATSLGGFNAVLGLEALNEPWQYTPLDVLKAFYWDAYWAVRAAAPHWLFVIQDSFRLEAWAGFMKGCPGVALDTHVYQAWFDIQSQQSFLDNACSWRKRIRAVQESTLPVLVGEWSLATDNCNMWLNGFHDNAPGYPRVACGSMACPQPYVSGLAGPPDGAAPGPHGTGSSAPAYGQCPISKPWENEAQYEPVLAAHKISAFQEAAGWFYWNFKAELQTQWGWQASQAAGWLPANLSDLPASLLNVCHTGDADDPPAAASSDLPWYNALPTRSASPFVLLMGVGLGTLLSVAVLLKLFLTVLVRSGARSQQKQLQLPPRLLLLARRSQGHRRAGLGVLGLKQRVSSRSLAQLAFPLMSAQHAINEADEESLMMGESAEHSSQSRRDLLASFSRGGGGGGGGVGSSPHGGGSPAPGGATQYTLWGAMTGGGAG